MAVKEQGLGDRGKSPLVPRSRPKHWCRHEGRSETENLDEQRHAMLSGVPPFSEERDRDTVEIVEIRRSGFPIDPHCKK